MFAYPLDRDPASLPTIATIYRPRRNAAMDSAELGAHLSKPLATLDDVLTCAVASLQVDGTVTIHFPPVRSYP